MTETSSRTMIYGIFAVLAGLILPAILIPIVQFTGYSEVLEEAAKTLIVLFVILNMPSHKSQILAGIGFGFLFGLSENILYLNQIFQLGDLSVFAERFLWTAPMHVITVLVILFSGLAGKKFLVLGFVGAVILHAMFNFLAAGAVSGLAF